MKQRSERGIGYIWPSSPFHRSEDRSLPRPPRNASSFAWPVRNRHRFDIPSRRTFRISCSTRLHIRSIRTKPNDFIPLLKFSNGLDRDFLVTDSTKIRLELHFEMRNNFIFTDFSISPKFSELSCLNLNYFYN